MMRLLVQGAIFTLFAIWFLIGVFMIMTAVVWFDEHSQVGILP